MPPSGDDLEWPNLAGPPPAHAHSGRPRLSAHAHAHVLASHTNTHAHAATLVQHQAQVHGHLSQSQSQAHGLVFGGQSETQPPSHPPHPNYDQVHERDFLHDHDPYQSCSSCSSSSASSSSAGRSEYQSMSSHESHLSDSEHGSSLTYAPTSTRPSIYSGACEQSHIDPDETAHGTREEGEGWYESQYEGAYSSDDTDMSDEDGGGAPLVNYLDIANILTGDMSSPTESYFEAAAAEYDAVNKEDESLESDPEDSDEDGTIPGPEPAHSPQSPPHQQHIPEHYYQHLPPLSTLPFPIPTPIPHPIHYNSIPDAELEPETELDMAMELDQDAHEEAHQAGLIHQALQTFNNINALNPLGPPAVQPPANPANNNAVPDPTNPHGANPPGLPSQNNAMTLRPWNQGILLFLETWAHLGIPRPRYGHGHVPLPLGARRQFQDAPRTITYDDLAGDRCDFQGINWTGLGVTREEARQRRVGTYTNYVNKPGSDKWNPHVPDLPVTGKGNYFKFRRMDIRKNAHLAHFQLRNLLTSPSRSRVFYAGHCKVLEFNPITGASQLAMKSSELGVHISTLAAGHGVLIAGGFTGEYCLKGLHGDFIGETPQVTEGVITTNQSGITNHVQLHTPRRSSSPYAAFASNDGGFRVLDIATETFISQSLFKDPLNCTAVSPDGRLRVMVGDDCDVYITPAEKERHTGDRPDIIHRLSGHRDYGFACDWAPDGYTVATGFQDKAVKIWDARRWTTASGAPNPLCTIRCEVAGARGLKFSPLGSGKRVLVAAEEADYVNIIDAQTFKSKQTIDVFGEIGGIDFVDEGRELHVLCADPDRGGLLQLERCGVAEEMSHDELAPVSVLGSSSHSRYAGLDRGENEYPLRGGTFDWPAARLGRREMEFLARRRRYAAATRGLARF